MIPDRAPSGIHNDTKYDMPAPQTSWILRLSLALIVLAGVGLAWLGPTPLRYRTVNASLPNGPLLQGRLWLPAELEEHEAQGRASEPPAPGLSQRPGVLLIQGVASTQRDMFLLARRLSERGLIVMSADFETGLSFEQLREQASSALYTLRQQPWVNAEKVAVIGHSLGAQIAAETALSAGAVRCPVGIGMHPKEPASQPEAMAWLTGRYDILHPPHLEVSWQAVSATANHHIEPHEAGILNALESHLSRCLAYEIPETGSREQWRFWLSILLALGFAAVLWCGPLPRAPWALTLLWLLPSALLLVLGYFHGLTPERVASACVILACVYALKQLPARAQQLVVVAPVGVWLLRDLVNLLRTLPQWWSEPLTLLYFPGYLVQSLLYMPLLLQRCVESLLLQQVYTQIQPSVLFYLVGALSLLYPRLWRQIFRGLTPRQTAEPTPPRGRPRLLQWSALALALVSLLAVSALRLQQGFVRPELLAPLARLVLADLLPTALLCALVWWFYTGKKCPRDDSNVRPTV